MSLFHCVLIWLSLIPLFGQSLEPDASSCVDSKIIPKLLGCRIDNCENKVSDHRDVPTREDEKGEALTSAVDGESRSLMYECREATTPADIVEQAVAILRAAQFEIPYRFSEKEGAVTAQKGDLWILVEAASRYYTLVELRATPADESAIDAAEMAGVIERQGHIAVYGAVFLEGRADMTADSTLVLREIVAMMSDHPEWRIRVEEHSDSAAAKPAGVSLSQQRAAAVVAWLVGQGIKRERLESAGFRDVQPEKRGHRIELVKIGPLSP